MAVMQSRDNRTFEAGADLSAGQFKFVSSLTTLLLLGVLPQYASQVP